MSQQIAEFYAKITADTAGFQKSLDDANKKLDDLARQSDKSSDKVGGLGGMLASLINPTTIAIGAFTALAAFFKESAAAAAEAAQVDAKLASVLQATGYAAGLTAEDIDMMSTSLSKLSGVDDEAIKSGAAVLATFREVGENVFPQAMQAALDMSAVMGQDLQSSIVQIGKALNDPIAGVTALRKVGVQLTDQQQEQIKVFMANGDIMSAQKVILEELGMEFGGAAKAMNDASDGSANLKVALGNLQEAIGEGMVDQLRATNSGLTEFVDRLTAVQVKQNNFRDSLRAANPELYKQAEIWGVITPAMREAVAEYENGQRSAGAYTDRLTAMADAYRNVSSGIEEAVMSEEQFNSEMGALSDILSGDLGPAQDAYNAKITEYREQLEEARSVEDKRAILDKINEETAAYNKRAMEIAFNIQQEAILNSQLPPEAKLNMITALGQAYGIYDEETAKAMESTNEWINRVQEGTLTEEAAIQYMRDMGMGLRETASAATTAIAPLKANAEQVYHTGRRSEEAAEMFGNFGSAALEMGDAASDASGPVGGLKSELNGMPASGTSWQYSFQISVSGRVPNMPNHGESELNAGVGYQSGQDAAVIAGGPDYAGSSPMIVPVPASEESETFAPGSSRLSPSGRPNFTNLGTINIYANTPDEFLAMVQGEI